LTLTTGVFSAMFAVNIAHEEGVVHPGLTVSSITATGGLSTRI